MNISQLFLKKPVTTIVINLIIILLGIISFSKINVRQIPNIDSLTINIEVGYQGASAEIIESEISYVIEDALWGVDGIESITSYNNYEYCDISLKLNNNANLNEVFNNVNEKISILKSKLPQNIDSLIIEKKNIEDKPIMYVVIFSDKLDIAALSDIATSNVRESLLNVEAVANVNVHGARPNEVRIFPNLAKIAYYKLNLAEIENIIRKNNSSVTLGRITTANKNFLLYSDNDFKSKEDIENIIIKSENGALLKLKEIALIEEGPKIRDSYANYNGKNSIFLTVKKKSGGNPVEISDKIRELISKISKTLPEDVKIEIGYDSTEIMRASIKNIYHTIFEAIICVCIIIFLFLKQNLAIFIPLVTIPICLIGSIFFIYLLGFSLNIFTLLALILAVGLVVDDAIVMMENIYKYIEQGSNNKDAAYKGSKEVGFVIMSVTVILLIVFLPIGFMNNMVGKLFIEFAWTIAITVAISGIVAVSLTPVMSEKILKISSNENRILNKISNIYEYSIDHYKKILDLSIKYKNYTIIIASIISIVGILTFTILENRLLPMSDTNIIHIWFQGAEGMSFDRKRESILQIEAKLSSIKEIKSYLITADSDNHGSGLVSLKPRNERSSDIIHVLKEIKNKLKEVSDVEIFSTISPAITLGKTSLKANNDFYLQGSDFKKIYAIAGLMVERLKNYEALYDIEYEDDVTNATPKIAIEILKNQASIYHLEPNDVLKHIQLISSEKKIGLYKKDNNLYDIKMGLERKILDDLNIIKNSFIRNKLGKMLLLADLIKIRQFAESNQIIRYNKLPALLISLSSNYSSDKTIRILEKVHREVDPNHETKISYTDQLKEFNDTIKEIYLVFILSILFIYLVLAAQFESFKDPFIIILAIPFAITGAFITLKITGNNINIYSQIGIITLLGLITKNSIMIIECLNEELKHINDIYIAVRNASIKRFRPIIMTSLAAIFGALPMAIKSGYGSESLNNIGWVIVGGLTIGTFFTIIVIPVICIYFKSSNSMKLK